MSEGVVSERTSQVELPSVVQFDRELRREFAISEFDAVSMRQHPSDSRPVVLQPMPSDLFLGKVFFDICPVLDLFVLNP